MRNHHFSKVLLLLSLILTLSLQGLSKKEVAASNWAATPLTIDGNDGEWKGDILNFEKKVDVDFGFRNDAETLYVLFIFKNPKYLSSINRTGMTLWFNTEGKKKKNYGLVFTKKQVSADVFISIIEQQKGALSEEEKNNIKANPRYFLHNVKAVDKDGKSIPKPADSAESNVAVFRSEKQEEKYFYEFAVPLKKVTVQANGIGTEPGRIVKIGFEWGGLTEEQKKARAERRQIPGTDAMRRGESSDSWARRNQGFSDRAREGQSPIQYFFWVDVQLASNQLSIFNFPKLDK